ncbi:hypothetical protein WMF30_53270 [Sorangium sp. So ce134]
MVARGKADGSSPANTLTGAYSDIQGFAGNGSSLGWDYFNDKFGIGKPPGLLPPAQSLKPRAPAAADLNTTYLQLVVKLDTPFGENTGVIVIYWGPFQRDKPPDADARWRIYVGVKAGAEHTFKEIPLAGHLDDGAFAVRGIQVLITSHDMTAAESEAMYKVLMDQAPPTSELGATNYDKVPTPPLAGINSRITEAPAEGRQGRGLSRAGSRCARGANDTGGPQPSRSRSHRTWSAIASSAARTPSTKSSAWAGLSKSRPSRSSRARSRCGTERRIAAAERG